MAGWVYIISNKAMPGILKIGYTERTPYIRAYELYNTGCPYPYKVDYSVYVNKPYEVEQKTHELQHSTNVGKEWFSCSQEQAIKAISYAIEICGAAVEKRDPPEPTRNELNNVIKINPDVASIIRKDSIDYSRRLNHNGVIMEFFHFFRKINYLRELDNINKEYENEISNYKKQYESEIIGMKEEPLLDILGKVCGITFIVFLFLCGKILPSNIVNNHWGVLFFIHLFIALTITWIYKTDNRETIIRKKSTPFEDAFRNKINSAASSKNQKESSLMYSYAPYFKIINDRETK